MGLSGAQRRIATIVLAAAGGDLSLVGGAGLIVSGLTDRATDDIDAFTARLTTVDELDMLRDRAADALQASGCRLRDMSHGNMRTLMVTSAPAGDGPGRPPETVKVQIGMDYQALPAVSSEVGPVLSPIELGANKILAVYGRTRARDAEDIARLAHQLDFQEMLRIADGKETVPLDRHELAGCFRRLTLEPADTFPVPEMAPAVKDHMLRVAEHLETGTPVAQTGPYA